MNLVKNMLCGWMGLSGVILLSPVVQAQNVASFQWIDGDRVVMVGDTLIEREGLHGHLEYMCTIQSGAEKVTFRNLGWSADLPHGQSRVSFDWHRSPQDWLKNLLAQIEAAQPTVVIVGYGMAASLDPKFSLDDFKLWMERLVDGIKATHPKARFIFLTPIRHETLPAPWPDPSAHNQHLAEYSEAIRNLADKYKAHFVSLFEWLIPEKPPAVGEQLTDNGIHLNEAGSRRMAEVVARGLNWLPSYWQVGVLEDGKIDRASVGQKTNGVEKKEDRIKWSTQPEKMVMPPWPEGANELPMATLPNRIQIRGLAPGDYGILMGGERIAVASNQELGGTDGVILQKGPVFDQARELLGAIRKKNSLFFHRWRPQNSTYLFLFRKHEQGQNAREIPMFDPLIQEEEGRIARLRLPGRLEFEIKPLAEAADVKPTREVEEPGLEVRSEPPQKNVTPQARPEFTSDPQIEISLWAENPLLAKPIQMNFDTQGRLWVASSSIYPQIEPGQEANDKVLILEDTDGDGQADSSTVFADGLLIPTGVEPGQGGVFVGHSTELLHFKDTDGDGKADEKRIVLSGFGTEDTHHILHTLRWGHDGLLYMNQSIYIHTHVETPQGVVRLNSGGILSLDPRNLDLSIFMKGLVNSWGHHVDRYGQSFATDGAGTPQAGLSGITYVVPGAMYHTYAGARKILGSVSPGSYPKFAGLEFLRSPHFPDSWQENLITCDFRANRVVRFAVEEKDSAYVATEQPLFIRSKNVTFRPIDVKMGPDGALYIADWSNPIIQHGEVDFRDPRRDHVHGRIWRVTFKGRDLDSPPDLAKLDDMDLLDLLLSPNGNTRKQARRVMIERGEIMRAPLKTWVQRQTTEQAKLEALWMYQSLTVPEPALLSELLQAKDGRVRAAAVRVLSAWGDHIPTAQELLAVQVTDSHPRVRLETLRALSNFPSVQSIDLALKVLDQPMDRHLDYALWLTVNDLANPWLEAVKANEWPVEGRENKLEFVLNALEPSLAGQVMTQLMTNREMPTDGSGPWFDLVSKAGGPHELRILLDQALQGGFNDAGLIKVLGALERAGRVRNVKPSGNLDGVGTWLGSASPEVRRQAIILVGVWKGPGDSLSRLITLVGAADTPANQRQAAFESLRSIGGNRVVNALLPLCRDAGKPAIRRQAVQVVTALNVPKGAPEAVALLTEMKDENEALDLWRRLLRVKGASDELVKVMPKTGLPVVMAKTGLRAAREGGRNEAPLILALSSGADLDEEAKMLSPEEMKQLATRVMQRGNPAQGEMVYRRLELACTTCHSIGGVGGKVGPDLTSIGASAPVDYLIESLLYPNRKIKEGYHTVVVETRDDEEYAGILVRESSDELFLLDASNQEMAIPKNNVAARRSGNSLMPAGLVDTMGNQDRLDLFRFIAELGKPGPFDATQGTVARFWRLSPGTIDLAQFGDDKILQSDLKGRDWMTAAATVDGRLLEKDFKAALAMKSWRGPKAIYAAARFELAKPGRVRLGIDLPPGAQAWIGTQSLKLEGDHALAPELPAGIHTVMIKVDVEKMPQHIRLTVDQGTFLVD